MKAKNGNGEEGGGVAVAGPPESGDMVAITEQLCKLTGELATVVRRVLETFNDGTFKVYLAGKGVSMQEWAASPAERGAAGSPRRNEDLTAIEAGLKQRSDEEVRAMCDLIEPPLSDDDRTRLMDFFAACCTSETVASIRQTVAMYNSDNYDAYVAKHDDEVQDVVGACLPEVDKAILLNKIAGMLRNSTVEFVAGIEVFLRLATEGAAA